MHRIALALALVAAPLAPAFAHDHDWPLDTDLTIEQALEIAYGQGITLIREADFDDGYWEIKGRNQAGAEIEIRIDGASGDIVSPT